MDKCPKCGKKLSLFYVKQTCNDCGCNILYYDMDKRLEEDAKKAEAEFESLNKFFEAVKTFFEKITPSFLKKRKETKDENNGIE